MNNEYQESTDVYQLADDEKDEMSPKIKFLLERKAPSDVCPFNVECSKEKCMMFDINSNNCKLALISDVLESISCRLELLVEIFKEKKDENAE